VSGLDSPGLDVNRLWADVEETEGSNNILSKRSIIVFAFYFEGSCGCALPEWLTTLVTVLQG